MNQTILPQPSMQPSQPSANEQNKNKPRSGIINTILLIIIILILLLLSFGTVYALNPTYVQNIVQQITAPVEKVIGPQGNVGNTGEKGEPGARGAQGISGKNGDQGQPGERGLQGISGSSGVSGSAGAQGNDGKIGPQGSTGVLGVTNDSNVTGALSGQNLTLGFSGILPVSRGGTGLNIIPSGALLLGGAGSLSTITPGTNGQILSIVGGVPTYANAAAGFADPLTTTGDIIYRNSSGTTRLAVGTNGQILSVVAGVPAYTNPTAYIAGAGLQLIGNTFSLPGVGTAGTFGSATQIPVITVDAQGRVSTITLQTVATAPVSSVFGRTGIVVAQNGDYTTDQVTEGIANLYFTPSRFTTQFTAKTTDNLAQGTTNKYYATSLFNADFGAKTSDNLTEGVANLYFSNSRARSALSGGVGISYNSTTGVITGAPPISILTAATSTNTIDNIGFQQNWNWNSLTTGIGLQIDSNSLTTGQLVRIASTASVPSGGTILKVDSSGGGPGDAFSVQQFGIDRFKVTAQGQTRIEPVGRLQLVYFTANEPKLQFLDSSGTNFVAFSAPTTVPSNVTWTLPSTDGVSGSVLSTSGSGILSWNVTNGLSSLLAASNSNSIDNLNYDQTWNWSSATTQNPLTIGANALTSGKALNVTSNSNGLVAGGALINANYTGSSTSGSILRAQKNGVNVFSVDTNGNSLVG